jgi:hypothetical protein
MISSKLVELIEIHAAALSHDVAQELATDARTAGFRAVDRADLEPRIFQIFNQLGNWIGDPQGHRVQAEFEEWGVRRFGQGIKLSEIVHAIIVLKRHLRRYIRDHGVVDASFPRIEGDYVLPMHLHSLQDLNFKVGEFFDEALYHLARGYEAEAARLTAASSAAPRTKG